MAATFISWPVLTEEMAARAGYVRESLEVSYSEGVEQFPLAVEEGEAPGGDWRGAVRDGRCTWHPETHDLQLDLKCRLTSAYMLFGPTGLAPRNSLLGLALRWVSTRSQEQGVIPFGEICPRDTVKEFSLTHVFGAGRLRGSLKLETVLYLKQVGDILPQESFLASAPGAILGRLDQEELVLDGSGSVFPIAVISRPGGPLWEVWFPEGTDPMTDLFQSDNVEIRLNRAHPSYPLLKIESSLSTSPLFLEVLASALQVIVETAIAAMGENWEQDISRTDPDQGPAEGSIAQALCWFTQKLNWDVSSPAALSLSIRSWLEGLDTAPPPRKRGEAAP